MKANTVTDIFQALPVGIVLLFLCAFTVVEVTAEDLPQNKAATEHGLTARESNPPADRDAIYREGPHHELECTRCHRENGEDPGSAESVTGDSILLCRECHQVEHLHPMGVELHLQTIDKESFILPLGKGILQGKIVCYTCHAMHEHGDTPHLLNGEKGTYQHVRDFLCFSCHTDYFSGRSPHSEEASRCRFCHIKKPQKKETVSAPPDLLMQAACNPCHPNLPPSHYEGMDPFIDRDIRQRAEEAGDFLAENQVVCTSCHDPHAEKSDGYHLRSDYLALCLESRATNPHWNEYLCLSCHIEEPVKGNAPLRENGDKNLVCNRCHHSEYARPDIHPVNVVPSRHIRVPEDMPLEDGKLTCNTCHYCRLQMGRRQDNRVLKTNPNFLRKTQIKRNSYCFLCHLEETYKRLNPHNQLNAQGEVDEETCLFCHASIPDVNFIGPEKVSFIIHNPDEYCVGCHHGFTQNHPAGVNHLIEPSEKIRRAILTSVQRIGVELPLFEGKIVCATCHNPHQEGVIKISAAAKGSKRENKLRLMPGRSQCTGCHWDK